MQEMTDCKIVEFVLIKISSGVLQSRWIGLSNVVFLSCNEISIKSSKFYSVEEIALDNMTIEDIQVYMRCWGQYTYREEVDRFYSLRNNAEMRSRIMAYMERLDISNRYMDGNSVTNLLRNDDAEGNNPAVPQYTKVFNRWLNMSYISPLTYIYQICESIPDNISEALACGIIARGLRSFASFFRELELTKQIEARIPGCTVHARNAEVDILQHTDILIEYNNTLYRLWSYQSSGKGIKNTSERFAGMRGEIPNGIHIMCPFSLSNIDNRQNNGWLFYSESQCRSVVDMIISNYVQIDFYENINKHQNALKEYLMYFRKIYKR